MFPVTSARLKSTFLTGRPIHPLRSLHTVRVIYISDPFTTILRSIVWYDRPSWIFGTPLLSDRHFSRLRCDATRQHCPWTFKQDAHQEKVIEVRSNLRNNLALTFLSPIFKIYIPFDSSSL